MSAPDLKIKTGICRITNINPRSENKKDEHVAAADVSVDFTVGKDGKEILEALHMPEMTNAMYDSDGDPSEASGHVSFKCKQKAKNVRVGISAKKGEAASILHECDLKSIELMPQPDWGIRIKCKVQAHPDLPGFQTLMAIWLEGECNIDIAATQAELDLAA